MSLKLKSLIALFTTIAIYGCDNSGSSSTAEQTAGGSGNETPTSGGPGGSTSGPISFAQVNFEGEPKHFGPRIHAIVGEVYRNLWLIHQATIQQGSSVEARFTLAGSDPVDDLYNISFEDCTNSAGITTQFKDIDNTGGFTSGDTILRDFDNVECSYAFLDPTNTSPTDIFTDDTRPANIPTKLTGSIVYTLTAVNSGTGEYAGTARFGDANTQLGLNYEMENGLLKVLENETASDAFNGTVTFDINFDTGIATFSDIDVTMTGGSGSIAAPSRLQITELVRTFDSPVNTSSVEITGGTISSLLSGANMTFSTAAFNDTDNTLKGTTGSNPNTGSIVFVGANNTAARVRTDINGGGGIVDLDDDGDGLFDNSSEAEPGGFGFYVTGFLMPQQTPSLLSSSPPATHNDTPFNIFLVFSNPVNITNAAFSAPAGVTSFSISNNPVNPILTVTPDGTNTDIDITINTTLTNDLGMSSVVNQTFSTITYTP